MAPLGEWLVWLLLMGRGSGKTRAGAEWFHREAMAGGEDRYMALVARTPADARDDMILGPSGLLNIAPPGEEPDYQPSKRRIEWPTGAVATIYSGANPEQVRGFSGDRAWCDELAAWDYVRETWNNLMFGMREAKVDRPKICVTTTPKPLSLLKELIAASYTTVARGSSYENRDNLSPEFYETVIAQYEGTTLGQQEIYALLLDEDPRALWKRKDIIHTRAAPSDRTGVVVAIDPAVSHEEESDETGIVVCAKARNGRGYVLEDLSGRYSPDQWAKTALDAFRRHSADKIVAERNNGGEMVEHTIRTLDKWVAYESVWASRGKETRAQPIAALYEQGRIDHVGAMPDLEDQMVNWVPGESDSPDRVDALVWGMTDLFPPDSPVAATWGN